MIWKQQLAPSDGAIIGKFKDGSAAVVLKRHDSGRAVLFGFLPGQAYVKSGVTVRPVDRGASPDSYAHTLPTAMSHNLRARLVDDFLGRAGPDIRPVICSNTLVETTCIDTPPLNGNPARLAVPLINWSGFPDTGLTVTIRGVDKATKVRSVEKGELKFTLDKGNLVVQLPLDAADMLLIDR
jgi:hypothetical protein